MILIRVNSMMIITCLITIIGICGELSEIRECLDDRSIKKIEVISREEDALAIGTASEKSSGTPVSEWVYWKTLKNVKITGYCPCQRCCRPHANGETSTGTNAWKPVGCGVDPRAIPYRVGVEIPGYGIRVADDTGGKMRSSWRKGIYHVDVRMVYHWQARNVGTGYKKVKLYRRKR